MRAYRQFASVYDRLMEDMPYSDWMRFARGELGALRHSQDRC